MHAAGALIIEKLDNIKKILLIKRSPDKKVYPNAWAFPGGRSEEGESPEDTVIREIKEEIDLDFVIERLFETNINSEKTVYRFLGEASGEIVLQEEEVADSGYFSFEESFNLDLGFNCAEVIGMLRDEGLM